MKAALRVALVTAVMLAAPASYGALPPTASAAPRWNGPIRLPWYGSDYYGKPVACPGENKYTRWDILVAVRAGSDQFKCGDRIELKWGKQRVIARVADRFASNAPSWVMFDASARIACNLLNPPNLRPEKPGRYQHCFTRDGVKWRRVP